MSREIDITGKKYGRLTAICKSRTRINGKSKRCFWIFKCDCGKELEIYKYSVTSGGTVSCGCYNEEMKHKRAVHGETGTRLHNIFCNMHSRCSCGNNYYKNKKNYYDRGIRVCEEWKDFLKFKEWALKNGYMEDLTIDRIDVNGNYCPENCRWANQEQQQNNKRVNRKITINGVTNTLKQWLKVFNISRSSFYNHKKMYCWDDETALTHRLDTHGKQKKVEYK